MADHPSSHDVVESISYLFEETFENHPTPGNAFLDAGTGFLATLHDITAEQASRRLVHGGTTIAGHVEHTLFYLRVAQEFWDGRTEKVDWRESWLVTEVSPEEWDDLRHRLELEYRKVADRIRANDLWDSDRIGGAFGLMAHCAYHLGAVRQMMKLAAA
jgi:hypothetical protein